MNVQCTDYEQNLHWKKLQLNTYHKHAHNWMQTVIIQKKLWAATYILLVSGSFENEAVCNTNITLIAYHNMLSYIISFLYQGNSRELTYYSEQS